MLTLHTAITSDSKPPPRATRYDLIGNHLRRDLSYLLVLTLLLLSAITFSTDKIPNFKPDCKTTSVQKCASTSPVAVVRCPSLTTVKNCTPSPLILPVFSAVVTPIIKLSSLPAASRAPPESLYF